ncbi:MAG TPA: RNA polymerase sigma factor, partial [Hanamia sp.]|nr:RNA polymerase sigma factor [Hanamia sp.]
HQMIDHIRKNKRVQLQENFSAETRTTLQPHHNINKILNEALQRLSETQRSLVLLKDYEGYSYDEIAKITSLSESQVKVYLHRARIQLKSWLVKPENVI